MAEYRFHEMGDFIVNVHAVEKQEERWAAFIFFERKADCSKLFATATRLHIQQDFGSADEALIAAAGHAAQSIQQGETGL